MDAGLCHAGGGVGKDCGRWQRIAEKSPARSNRLSIMPADARRDTTG
jgi:hypothetical protein